MKDSGCTILSKMKRIHSPNESYHKCTTLAHWLFVKYDMSYKAFQNKSKSRKDKLRKEWEEDTFDFRSTYHTTKIYMYLYSIPENSIKKIEYVCENLPRAKAYRILDVNARESRMIPQNDVGKIVQVNNAVYKFMSFLDPDEYDFYYEIIIDEIKKQIRENKK